MWCTSDTLIHPHQHSTHKLYHTWRGVACSQGFPPSSFWSLAVCKNRGGRAGPFYHLNDVSVYTWRGICENTSCSGDSCLAVSLKNLHTYRYKWFHCLPVEIQSCTHSGRTLVHSHTCDHTRHCRCHTHWCLERRERIRQQFNQSQGHIWLLDRKLKSFHC